MNTTREFILQTSLKLFLQKSYKDVTMKEIVEKTGLSKGAFYHYFTSKEELYKEIFHMLLAMGNVPYEQFPKTSLAEFYQFYLKHTEQSTTQLNEFFGSDSSDNISFNFFIIMFEAMAKHPEFLDVEFRGYEQSLTEWIKVIQTAKEIGEIKSNASNEDIANLFLFCTDGSFIRYVNHPKYKGTYIDFLRASFDTIYKGLEA